MTTRESPHGYWSSSRSFVLAAGATTIGLGSVWRMPYLIGEYGGGAFLVAYVLALAIVVLPLLVAELMIGRFARRDLVGTMRLLAFEGSVHRSWTFVGRLALLGAVLVLSYYSVIAGWSLGYLMRASGGVFANATPEATTTVLRQLVGDPERSLAWHTIFMVAVTICVSHGLRKGLEPIVRYLLPGALLALLGVLYGGLTFGKPDAALQYLFSFDFGRLGWRGLIEALHQAYFSLSLGVGVMSAFGVFLPNRTWLISAGVGVISIDLFFALLAGTGIFAFIFAAGMQPTSGVRLVFETLPLALGSFELGSSLLALFYLALVFITMIAAVGLTEPVVQWLMETFRISRVFAATSAGLLIWMLGLGTVMSFSVTAELTLFGRNYFEWLDLITARILLPLVGLLICIFVGRILPQKLLLDAWADEPPWAYAVWRWCMIYPARIGLILVLLYATGLIDQALNFWAGTPS